MIFQTVLPEESVFCDTGHGETVEVALAGRVVCVEKTDFGIQITALISSNPNDFLCKSLFACFKGNGGL